MYASVKKQVEMLLAKQSFFSVTVDIWTDRIMRSYLGITAHTVNITPITKKMKLQSVLLKFQRFTGSHTAENIFEAFHEAMDEANLKKKVEIIVTDNAANMRAAFKTSFPGIKHALEFNEDNDEEPEDDDEAYYSLENQQDASFLKLNK